MTKQKKKKFKQYPPKNTKKTCAYGREVSREGSLEIKETRNLPTKHYNDLLIRFFFFETGSHFLASAS
jgi:hypothetical protein